MKKSIVIFFIILLVGVISVKRIRDKNAAAKTFGVAAVPVYAHKVSKSNIMKTERFVGAFEAESTITVSAQLTQKIKKIYKSEKDFVKENELLAELDTAELDEKANFINTKIQSIDFEIDSVNANLKAVEQNYIFSKTELERNKNLLEKKVISQSVYDNSVNMFEKALSDYESTKIRISKLNTEKESLKSNINEIDILKSYTKIRAVTAGIIAKKFAEKGDLAIAGKPLFIIEAADNYKIVFYFPQEYAGQIKENNKVFVNYNGVNLNSKIYKIYPSVNQNRMMTAEIIINSEQLKNEKILFGKYIYADVVLAEKNNVIIAPSSSIKLTESDTKMVYMINDNKLNLKEIETGIFNGKEYEVINGLDENEIIAVGGFLELNKNFDGQKIKIVE